MNIEYITDERYLIGNSEYGYYYCEISFHPEPIERGDITEDDIQDICEVVKQAINNALEDKEDES